MTFTFPMSFLDVATASCAIRLAPVAAVGALRSRRTAPAKVTAEERLGEQRCASHGSGRGRAFC